MSQLLEEQIIRFRRDLHKNPELSNEEFETTKKIKTWLQNADIRLLNYPIKTGVIAEIGSGKAPIIALRADIDALPIEELSGVEFASQISGKMHACGHDFHTAVILGAASLLKQQESSLPGTVRIFFQPAEETCDGAQQLIAAGGLNNVDAIFGLHNAPGMAVGEFGTRTGALSANVDRFEIIVNGVGAHAAMPEKGIDTIVTTAQIITALQTIPSRVISGMESLILSVTKVIAGNTWNVLPEQAFLEGTVRTYNADVRTAVPKKISQIINGIAASAGASAELRWYPGPPSVVNHAKWADFTKATAAEFGYQVHDIPPQLGGEDFSYYLHHVPGAFVNIGSASKYGLHHPKFNVNEEAIFSASRYFTLLAKKALAELNREI